MNFIYRPKGSMCTACVHAHKDCSDLPFNLMKVIETDRAEGHKVVLCNRFLRAVKVTTDK